MRTPGSRACALASSLYRGPRRAAWQAAAAVAAAALLTSCAAPGTGRSSAGVSRNGGGHSSVTLSRDGQAWQLTALTVSVRSGGAWQRLNPPAPPAQGNSVVVRGSLALVASVAGTTLTLAVSHDGGGTWATSTAPLGTQTTAAFIAVSPDETHWMVGPASDLSTGGVSQYSTGFVNATSGTLSQVSLPGPAADLAWSGSAMLVPGGPGDSHLYMSTSLGQSWQDVSSAVLGFTPPASDIPATEPVFGPLIGLSGGAAVIPVEHVTATGLIVDLEATTTGTSYTSIGTTTASGDYGGGPLALASSSYGPDEAAFVPPGTTNLYIVASQGPQTTIHMSGLPVSPDSISFQNAADGIAQTTLSSCANGKSDCTVTVTQYLTTDGGHTWTAS